MKKERRLALSSHAREKRRNRRVEIRSEGGFFFSDKKERCQRSPITGEVRDGRWTEEKAVAAISGFSDGKFKTEREFLCVTSVLPRPKGESRRRHGGDRVKILSYFRMTGLGLVSRGLLSSIFDPTTACLGNVLFDAT